MRLHNIAGLVLMLSTGPALAYDCTLSATPLNFGSIEGVAGQTRQSTATLTVVCRSGNTSADVNYQILMDGQGSGGERQMTVGDHNTGYQLYTSGSYQQVWNNTGSGMVKDSYRIAANDTVSRTYTVYAKMKTARKDPPGAYLANLTVQLVY